MTVSTGEVPSIVVVSVSDTQLTLEDGEFVWQVILTGPEVQVFCPMIILELVTLPLPVLIVGIAAKRSDTNNHTGSVSMLYDTNYYSYYILHNTLDVTDSIPHLVLTQHV